MQRNLFIMGSLLFMLTGCSSLPSHGPSSDVIVSSADKSESQDYQALEFKLIDISHSNIPSASTKSNGLFSNAFVEQEQLNQNEYVSYGDVIEVRIWETADNGLFASSGNRETVLSLIVSNSGHIRAPYAGRVFVVGKTVQNIRANLLASYRGKAIDPEINVSILKTVNRAIPVLGAVTSPGRISISPQGIKLLDLLALAGGARHASWETRIIVTRDGKTTDLLLNEVYENDSNNIVLLPKDSVQVSYQPRLFSVYGAIEKPGNLSFSNSFTTLMDLLGESGGLKDLQAEAKSVFVFRPTESELDGFKEAPIAYRVDFSKADSFLLAKQFEVLPSDIVYVASSDASEFKKFMNTMFSPLISTATGIQFLSK